AAIVSLMSLAAAAASAEEPAPKPLLTLTADSGYYEEAFGLDGAGGRLAVIHTDAAGAHELQLVDIDQKGALLAHQPLPATPPVALYQLSMGTLIVTRAEESGPAEAALFSGDKPARTFGQATDYAIS